MLTRRDILRAQAYNRRRLLHAFATGGTEPDGRVGHPARSLIGGLALSALLVAGTVIAGQLSGRPPAGWLAERTVVVERETGQQYLVVRGGDEGSAQLRAVPNRVSAMLLTGDADPRTTVVPARYVRRVERGAPLGLDGAPERFPTLQVSTGWTACVADGTGIRVGIEHRPAVGEAVGLRVAVDDSTWWVATGADGTAHRWLLTEDLALVPDALGFPPGPAPVVPRAWLDLFEVGAPLTLPDLGVSAESSDLVRTPQGVHLMTARGPVRLTEFAALLHRTRTGADTVRVDRLDRPALPAPLPADWPAEVPKPAAPQSPVCALLQTTPDAEPRVQAVLGGVPPEGEPGQVQVVLDPGTGAAVRSRLDEEFLSAAGAEATSLPETDGAAPDGTAVLLDERGACYPLLGSEAEGVLGPRTPGPLVPQRWLALLPRCLALSSEAAQGSGSGRSGND